MRGMLLRDERCLGWMSMSLRQESRPSRFGWASTTPEPFTADNLMAYDN
jgi:hypothetical protein